jgi:fucose permease
MLGAMQLLLPVLLIVAAFIFWPYAPVFSVILVLAGIGIGIAMLRE